MWTRALTPLEREWSLRALCDGHIAPDTCCRAAVERCELIALSPAPWSKLHMPRELVAHLALAGRASGITLGCKVYIQETLFDGDGELPLSLVVHEVAHVAQYLREGTAGFLARYLTHYARGLARGLSDRDAYLAIPHEVEARRAEEALRKHQHDPALRSVRRLMY